MNYLVGIDEAGRGPLAKHHQRSTIGEEVPINREVFMNGSTVSFRHRIWLLRVWLRRWGLLRQPSNLKELAEDRFGRLGKEEFDIVQEQAEQHVLMTREREREDPTKRHLARYTVADALRDPLFTPLEGSAFYRQKADEGRLYRHLLLRRSLHGTGRPF